MDLTNFLSVDIDFFCGFIFFEFSLHLFAHTLFRLPQETIIGLLEVIITADIALIAFKLAHT